MNPLPFHDTLPSHPGIRGLLLRLPGGETAFVAEQGAQLLSWQGRAAPDAPLSERLYASPRMVVNGRNALRGGVPICFPQFNQRVLGGCRQAKHGFARNLPWTLRQVTSHDGYVQAELQLTDSAATRTTWPHRFDLRLMASLAPAQLRLQVQVTNVGTTAWPFALALHSYLRVHDVEDALVLGLDALPYWDAVKYPCDPDARSVQPPGPLSVQGEIDRVYARAGQPLTLHQGAGLDDALCDLRIEQSATLTETVVWNPGAELCESLPDMPADGYQHMLCVEAAAIDPPITLAPGQSWSGAQTLILQNR